MKQYTREQWQIIRAQMKSAETVAGYISENLETLTFSDVHERLVFLCDWLHIIQTNFTDNATETKGGNL